MKIIKLFKIFSTKKKKKNSKILGGPRPPWSSSGSATDIMPLSLCVMWVILEQFYPSSLSTIVPGIKQRTWIHVKVKVCTWKLQGFKNHLWLLSCPKLDTRICDQDQHANIKVKPDINKNQLNFYKSFPLFFSFFHSCFFT